MAYFTRILSTHDECPPFDELAHVAGGYPNVTLSCQGNAASWSSLLLSFADGEPIAAIERTLVGGEQLADQEIAGFVAELQECKPTNAARWVVSFLGAVRVIYAFQHLSGSFQPHGGQALEAIRICIWGYGQAILQADQEGFSNEEGYHIVWQFADDVSGMGWMAVRRELGWAYFEMDLGNREHRDAFLKGRVPPGTAVKLIS